MSGGSYDYIGYKISEIKLIRADSDPRIATFQKLLKLVGEAMHEIEWADSCDTSPGNDNETRAIDKCLEFMQCKREIVIKAHAYDNLKERLDEFFSEEL